MKTIFKYPLALKGDGITVADMPLDSHIIKADLQNGKLYIWAIVEKDNSPVQRTFRVVGTGWDLPERGIYIATYFDGPFVWHLFELLNYNPTDGN